MRVVSYILIAYMLILCALRAENIGTDTYHYADMVSGIKSNTEEKLQFQLFFSLLIDIARVTTFPFFLSLCAFLTYIPLLIVLNKSCQRYLPIALLLFVVSMQGYFMNSLNIIRQIMAAVFLLCSYYELNKGRKLKFAVWYIIALLTHTSSLLYLPFIFLSFYKFSFKTVSIIVICFNCFAFFFSSAIGLNTIQTILSETDFLNLYHFAYYANDSEHYGIIGMIKLLIPTSFICLYSYKVLKGHFYCRLYLWGTILLCITAPLSTFALRISMGLYVTELFLLPKLCMKQALSCSKYSKIVVVGYMSFLTIYFLYIAFTMYIDDKLLVPYRFFFEEV